MARAFLHNSRNLIECFDMGYQMREGLAFCITGGRAIFLDVEADRYFGLKRDWDHAFQALVADGSSGPQLASLVSVGILIEAETETRLTAPMIPVASQEMVVGALKPSLRLITKFVFAQFQAAIALRTQSLAKIMDGIDQGTSVRADAAGVVAEPLWEPLVAAFFASSPLRPRSGHCLSNSIAFMRVARSLGYKPQLILGVCAAPFSAHCWVQAGNNVLNDRVENIRSFEPIFAL